MKIKESTSVLLLFLISFFIFGFSHFIRFSKYGLIFPGVLPYFYSSLDVPYTYIINLFPFSTGHIFFPFVCGLVSVALFYLILRELNFSVELRFIASVFLIISPAMIFSAVVSTPVSLFLPILLFAFRLVLSENKFINFLGFCLFVVCCFFGFFESLLVILIIFFYVYLTKRLVKKAVFFGVICIAIASYFFVVPDMNYLPSVIASFFSDFGGLTGYSFFSIILAIIGINLSWIVKKRFAIVYLIILSMILVSLLFDSRVNVILNTLVVFFSAFAFLRLINRKWTVPLLRFWVILIIILGLLFSAISYVERVSNLPPSVELVEVLEWIGDNSNEDAVVLADSEQGFWINYFSNRSAFSNSFSAKFEVTDEIYSSRNIDVTRQLLHDNSISYIVVDKENIPRNLYFLFSNDKVFKEVYDDDYYEVWYVIG